MSDTNLQFDVHPSVVFQLGEDLITDAVQALIELVKNSYDADASYVKVTINTKEKLKGSALSTTPGYIIIEDDGTGMDLQGLRRGFFTISNSLKRDTKRRGKTTKGGRTPLGDKGLGRLGTQRLGYNLEIETYSQTEQIGYAVGFSWREFENQSSLQSININAKAIERGKQKPGTRLIISDLKDIDHWKRELVPKLEEGLSQMISPFKKFDEFLIMVQLDGRKIDFAQLSDQVRDTAMIRYFLQYRDNALTITGRLKLQYAYPAGSMMEEEERKRREQAFEQTLEDNGKKFFRFLKDSRDPKAPTFKRASDDKWFIEVSEKFPLASLDNLIADDKKIANPGPFNGEVDFYVLGPRAVSEQNVFDKSSIYKKYIKSLSGIRVYRDGFAVRVPEDWLGLATQWTSGASYYSLKPENTLGYIEISAKDNAMLEEKTDREGFKDSAYYRNFYGLLQKFVDFSHRSQEFLRRGWNDHYKQELKEALELEDYDSVIAIPQKLRQSAKEAAEPLRKLQQTLKRADKSKKTNSFEDEEEQLQYVENSLATIEELDKLSDLIGTEFGVLKEQLSQFYETTSLGITAEVLSHEMLNISDSLSSRTTTTQNYLREVALNNRNLLAYVKFVASTVSSMRKQLSHLSPSLKYVREQKELIDVALLFEEINDYHQERLRNKKIEIELKNTERGRFIFKMNKGKVFQVFDNLIINSEYWLTEAISRGTIASGKITFEARHPLIRVFDNGRGIDNSVEGSLFEPFVTTKAKGRGRGLGLFICRQLLDADDCSIDVRQKRNKFGNLFIFEIDLSGALVDDD